MTEAIVYTTGLAAGYAQHSAGNFTTIDKLKKYESEGLIKPLDQFKDMPVFIYGGTKEGLYPRVLQLKPLMEELGAKVKFAENKPY